MKGTKQYYTAQFLFKNKIEYAAIPKEYLKDKELSIKAKGLLTIIYTLPEEWDYNMKGLQKISGLTEKSLRTIIHEIEEAGYITIKQMRDKTGRFIYSYWIFTEKISEIDRALLY